MRSTIDNVTSQATQRLRLDAAMALTGTAGLPGPALVVVGGSDSSPELIHAPSDAVIARSVEEVRSTRFVETHQTIVTATGFSLALQLIASDELDLRNPVTWSFGVPLLETFERLGQVGFPQDVAISRIGGQAENAIVTTSAGSGLELDFESFSAGLAAYAMLAGDLVGNDYSAVGGEGEAALVMLRQKLLNLLESLSPIDDQNSKVHAGMDASGEMASSLSTSRRLENELVLLKRRYDALERKYVALSTSRLGRLTLRLWARNRRRRNTDFSAKDGK